MDTNAPSQSNSDLSLFSFPGAPQQSNSVPLQPVATPTQPSNAPPVKPQTSAPLPQQNVQQPMQVSTPIPSQQPVPQQRNQAPAPVPQPVKQTQTMPTMPQTEVPVPRPTMAPMPQWKTAGAPPVPTIKTFGDVSTLSIFQMLEMVAKQNGSDLHIVVGYPPMIRIDGDLLNISTQIVTPEIAKKLVYDVLPDEKKEQLEVNREVDLAYGFDGVGRFRINAYFQRGYLSAAFRLIPHRIRSLEELRVPEIFKSFADLEQGLVLMTGPTGHGKSSSLAAIIQRVNETYPKHILTIEDPIEYVFPQGKALVSQRELGDDTHSWKGALRAALREDPDVVLVGEMRDFETINAAITVAETGHLVFATLHTNNAAQTIQRIINVFPDVQQEEVRSQLADILEVVVAQRLIPVKGGGRRAAVEIMLMTPAIRNLIRENKIYQIDNVIRTSLDLGMTTLERSLLGLYREGLIDQDTALRYAMDPNEMQRLIQESN